MKGRGPFKLYSNRPSTINRRRYSRESYAEVVFNKNRRESSTGRRCSSKTGPNFGNVRPCVCVRFGDNAAWKRNRNAEKRRVVSTAHPDRFIMFGGHFYLGTTRGQFGRSINYRHADGSILAYSLPAVSFPESIISRSPFTPVRRARDCVVSKALGRREKYAVRRSDTNSPNSSEPANIFAVDNFTRRANTFRTENCLLTYDTFDFDRNFGPATRRVFRTNSFRNAPNSVGVFFRDGNVTESRRSVDANRAATLIGDRIENNKSGNTSE